jgi:hypothetical protein
MNTETEVPSKSPPPEENMGDVQRSAASSSIDTQQQNKDKLTLGKFAGDSQDNHEGTSPGTSEGETDDEHSLD